MNLVPENINEAIKHLSPKSDEEITTGLEKDLEEIIKPSRNPEEDYVILQRLKNYVENYLPEPTGNFKNMSDSENLRVLGTLLHNIDTPVLKEAVRQTINDYLFG